MSGETSLYEDSFGGMGHGPGPEDVANGAAALAAGLVREAATLAGAAAALRTAAAPGPEGGDVRRLRLAMHAAGEAALRAAFALDAAALIGAGGPATAIAPRLVETAKRAGLGAAVLGPLLRAAALDFRTDDAAARIAASTLAAELSALLRDE
jgi:hypothetical protein